MSDREDSLLDVPDEPWTPDIEDDRPGDQLITAVFQAVGSASMCWEHVDRAGVFLTDRAKWVAEGLIDWLHENGWHKG